MEILYIWLENYRNGLVQGQGFNFSGQFQFEYDNAIGVLVVKENPFYLEGFFNVIEDGDGVAEVSNVTAIVGENGVGKSSILDFITENIAFDSSGIDKSVVIVLRDPDGVAHIYCHKELQVQNMSKLDINNTFPYVRDTQFGMEWLHKSFSCLENTQFILYSNVFDAKNRTFHSEYISNITTNYLVRGGNSIRSHFIQNQVLVYKISETRRQLKFLAAEREIWKKVFEPVPEVLHISFPTHDPDLIDVSTDGILEFIESVSEDSSLQSGEYGTNTDIFRKNLLETVLTHVILECQENLGVERLLGEMIEVYHQSSEEELYTRIMNWLHLLSQELKKEMGRNTKENFLYGLFARIIDRNIEFIEQIHTLLLDKRIVIGDWWMEVNVKQMLPKLELLLDIYNDAANFDDFMEMKWRDLSSGETARLNLFSRFYSVLSDCENKTHLIILIDEGEIYLHPQWQKNMLIELIEFLQASFVDKENPKKIQIIMTSNSPFVVSDLPSANVIFMKKINEQAIVMAGLDEHEQTFASNIHSLLSHTFFMSDGLFGSFAKKKINDVIDLLVTKGPEEINRKKDLIRNTIHIIGEPVIKHKLMNMLEEQLKLSYMDLDARITKLVTINHLKEDENYDSN